MVCGINYQELKINEKTLYYEVATGCSALARLCASWEVGFQLHYLFIDMTFRRDVFEFRSEFCLSKTFHTTGSKSDDLFYHL